MRFMVIFCLLLTINNFASDALKPQGTPVQLSAVNNYKIIIPASPSVQEGYAAQLLAAYIKKIFNQQLAIENEQTDSQGNLVPITGLYISIGKTKCAASDSIASPKCPQSYSISVKNDNLYIDGGEPGPLNGVIALLEEDLGCRWYAPKEISKALQEPEVVKVPQLKVLDFKVVPRNFETPFEVRELMCDYYPANVTGNWALLNRFAPISFHCRFQPETGAQLASVYFIHTYRNLLPTKEYYNKHPEYYALQQGKRIKLTAFSGSVCYTNKEVHRLMTEKILKILKKNPTQKIFSVSASDSSNVACECPKCTELINKEKLSGAQIFLANKISEQVAEVYPDIRITFLAYGIEPPKTIKPNRNLITFFAPIAERNNVTATLLPLQQIYKLRIQLRKWLNRSNKLYFWDYIANNSNQVPYPTFDTFSKSIRYLASLGVKGYFADCSSPNLSMARLKLWVFSKLMWNPEWNLDALITEFLNAYYGNAAPEMAEYVNIQRQAWKRFYKRYVVNRNATCFKFTSNELFAMRKLLESASLKAESEMVRARIARETLTFYTLTLKGNPKVTGIKQYECDYIAAEKLLKYLSPKADIFRLEKNKRWKKKLDWAKSPMKKGQYSRNTVPVNKTIAYAGMAERLKDGKALSGYATRHRGGKPWGVQYSYSSFNDYLQPGKIYVIRIRVRPEIKGTVPKTIFTIGAFQHNNEKLNRSQNSIPGNWPVGEEKGYKWITLGKLKFQNPDATGMFWINSLVKQEDAVWYDILEFIPIEEYRGNVPKYIVII